MNKNFVVTSFYTPGTVYEKSAKERLIPSLKQFDIPHFVVPMKTSGSWEANIHCKADVIDWALGGWPMSNVVWLDADAEVVQYPELFAENEWDFAPHWREPRKNLSSGTMFFRNNVLTRRLVEHWQFESGHVDPEEITEQRLLSKILPTHDRLRVGDVGLAYSTIFDGPQPEDDVVIRHHQASRTGRMEVAKLPK